MDALNAQIDKEETELVEKAKTNDVAFEELYERYFPKIFGYIFKRVGDKQNTEDIVSTTFMKAFSALPRYENKEVPFGAWLFTIATNNLTDFYRTQARKKEVAIDYVQDKADEQINIEQSIDNSFDNKKLRSIIECLPSPYQEVINLRFFAELSNIEISRVLNLSPAHVGVLIYRALKKCNKLYENV